jgi:dihydrodipicolinate synthase/N-acetylneuraminate lyase
MSTRYNNGSHYENHQRAAELHDAAAHAHRAAGSHGQQEHLTAHEQSRQALEYSHEAHSKTHAIVHGHSLDASEHAKIAARAHELWQARGCPEGSADEDWSRAVKELRSS